jgi:hypothetical protein
MGLLDRIKSWFSRKPKASTPSSPSHESSAPPPVPVGPLSEGDLLVQEHEQLDTERTRLRREIVVVDNQYSQGEIEAGDRDRAYRTRLARAGRISMRQLEIRTKLVEMGHPIPDDWGAISIAR